MKLRTAPPLQDDGDPLRLGVARDVGQSLLGDPENSCRRVRRDVAGIPDDLESGGDPRPVSEAIDEVGEGLGEPEVVQARRAQVQSEAASPALKVADQGDRLSEEPLPPLSAEIRIDEPLEEQAEARQLLTELVVELPGDPGLLLLLDAEELPDERRRLQELGERSAAARRPTRPARAGRAGDRPAIVTADGDTSCGAASEKSTPFRPEFYHSFRLGRDPGKRQEVSPPGRRPARSLLESSMKGD